jgi:hypothetical protein
MTLSGMFSCAVAWSGLWLGALVWAINVQLGQILPYGACEGQTSTPAIASFMAAAIAVAASAASWRYARSDRASTASASMLRFGGALAALCSLVFSFALAMQGLASLVLTGCER